ncbi:flocculation protein FLO11-like isoform X3 [Portunus trituberculatus]|nr:flocculation protein FLO11-like isoform X2 [Portunus trituberculatus]XP_045139126.1 flocculation protein FLO11-like isoform X3 [Portunus trituberculatus]
MSSRNSAEVSGSPSPALSSIGNNAPKYGTLVPNRVFVGGISANTTEQDLLDLFSQYGVVKATKIISDRAGVSKGYGFVTFETEEEARRLTQEADNIMLKDRKLNIAPAIKKQVSDVGYIKNYSPRLIDSSSSVVGSGGTVFFTNGAGYTTVPVMAPTEYHPTFPQATAAAPTSPSAYQTLIYPQPMYYPQQYQYQPTQQMMQPQWGAAPQWRWITPTSYQQPECSPQQYLAEHSSPAPGDRTTASATGSPPFTSTSLTLGCPSTPTTATATTTVCATVKTFSPTVTKTTATTAVSAKAGRSQDSNMQVKSVPLPAKPRPFIGLPNGNPTLTTKTTFGDDNDYSTDEDSTVDGRSNGTSSIPSPTSHAVSSSHSCITLSSSSSGSSKTTNTVIGSCSSNRNGSPCPKVPKNSGGTKKILEEVGITTIEQDHGCNRMINHTLERNRNQSGNMNQMFHSMEYSTDVPRAGSNIHSNKTTTWGGWMPATVGKETTWRPYVGHPAQYPHQYNGRTPYPHQYSGKTPYQYGSPSHLQTAHMTTPQSWTPIGYPLILPHSQPHSLRNNSSTFSHNMNQTLLLPQPVYSPHSNHMYNGTQPPPFSQSRPPTQDHQTVETSSKTPNGKPMAAQTKDGSSCPIASSIRRSNSTSGTLTKTTLSNRTTSPMNTPSPVVSKESCPTSHAGTGLNQTGYGCANQQHVMVMPYWQYSGSVAPYYNWAAPIVMQWPVSQSPSTPMHSTPNNNSNMAAQAKPMDSCLPHTALTFTPLNERHSTTTSPQVMTSKFGEMHSPANNSSFRSGRGGHTNTSYSRNRPYYSQAFHTSPYYSSPEMVCKQQPEQKKMEHPKTSLSSFPLATMSPCKFPKPVAPGYSQTVPTQKGVGFSGGGGVSSAKLVEQEDQCTTVPMTPPPTPLPDPEEISDAVANLNTS